MFEYNFSRNFGNLSCISQKEGVILKSKKEELSKLFLYQNLDSEMFSGLNQLCADCEKNGLSATVSMAFFYGLVTGKREERIKRR